MKLSNIPVSYTHLMDIILPVVDGLTILEKMKQEHIKKKVIVLTSYKKEYTINMTNNYGVSYYMLKPFSMLALETRIIELAKKENLKAVELNESERELHVAISKILHQLGIPSHIKGYNYIRESVFLSLIHISIPKISYLINKWYTFVPKNKF